MCQGCTARSKPLFRFSFQGREDALRTHRALVAHLQSSYGNLSVPLAHRRSSEIGRPRRHNAAAPGGIAKFIMVQHDIFDLLFILPCSLGLVFMLWVFWQLCKQIRR